MSDILLLAMPADHDRLRTVTGAMSEAGLDVFWDRAAPGSAGWQNTIARADEARCVIVFWSAATVAQPAAAYLALAEQARRRDQLIAVRLDAAPSPAGFEQITTYNLRGWRARASSLFLLDLVAGAQAKVAGLDPPLPRAPRQLLMKRLAVIVPSAIGAFALAIGLYRDIGIDRIASPAEARAWAAREPGSCADLRAFLATHPDGAHAGEAQALLNAKREQRHVSWTRTTRTLDLYVSAGLATPASSRFAAERRAGVAAQEEARRGCDHLARATGVSVVDVRVAASRTSCGVRDGGHVCSVDGATQCMLSEPIETLVERCGGN